MIARYLLSLILGTVVTFLLFAIMIALIHIGQLPVNSDVSFNMVDFIRQNRDRELNLDETRPEPPPLPSSPPPPARLQLENFATAPLSETIAPNGLEFDAPAGMTPGEGIAISAGGGEYLPIAQVAPPYPRDALRQGIEGWVQVEFTIGTSGQVKNPRIVAASPPGVFDEAALSAVKRFRFRPRTIGNTPVEVHGVQNRIRFRLER